MNSSQWQCKEVVMNPMAAFGLVLVMAIICIGQRMQS